MINFGYLPRFTDSLPDATPVTLADLSDGGWEPGDMIPVCCASLVLSERGVDYSFKLNNHVRDRARSDGQQWCFTELERHWPRHLQEE